MRAAAEVAALRQRLQAVADPAYAKGAKAYLKSDLEFIGARAPDLRRIARTWSQAHPGLTHADLVAVAKALWATAIFDLRLLATVLLDRHSELLGPRDLPWLERLLRDCRGWALLDNLAPRAVAEVLSRNQALRRRTLKRWARDADFWMRRTALLTMHRDLARGTGDWDLWTSLALPQFEDQPRWRSTKPSAEERFFIRKALGWVLRDRSRHHPDDVVAFVRSHRGRLSGLTLREATRRLAGHGPPRPRGLARHRGSAPAPRGDRPRRPRPP